MIEASGARDIADVFKLVPGFQVQHENGHTPIVTYHGMSDQFSRWMQVLVDGRSIYTPSIGGVEWSQIPLILDEIERIEVTRGPNSASFGSNAFAATINIITKHTSETNGTFFRFTAGSPNEVRDASIQFGNSINISKGNLDYRLMLGRLTDDGFADRNDFKRANLARLRMDYSNGAADNWLFEAGFNNGPRGLDDGNNYDNPERNYEKEVESSFQQLRWTHDLNENEEVYIQYFYNDQKVNDAYKFNLTADEFGLTGQPLFVIDAYNLDPVIKALDISLKTRRHDLEVQHTLVPKNDWRVAWGGSIRRDQFYSPGLISSNNEIEIDLLRAFANTEWRATDDLKVNAGAMWENSELTGVSLSPRLGLVYSIDRNNNLRIVTSKATRIPTMIEYDGEIIFTYTGANLTSVAGTGLPGYPNPSFDSFLISTEDINNETITSFEIGLNSHHPDIGFSADIRLYQDKITDIIYFAEVLDPLTDIPTPVTATPKNGGEVTIRGLEFQANINPFPGNRIVFTYSITDIENNNVLTDTVDSDFSDTASPENFSLLFSQRFKNNIVASLMMYRTSQYEGLGSGNKVDSYSQSDIRLAIPFRKNKFKGEIAFVSQNISGVKISDWAEDNLMERRNLITITGKFD
jgi:iron complex outermembrane receptor protein